MDIQPGESKFGWRVGRMEDDYSLPIYRRPRCGRRIGLLLFVPVGRNKLMGERYQEERFQLNIRCFLKIRMVQKWKKLLEILEEVECPFVRVSSS